MITYEIMKKTELKQCALLASKSFYDYDYFSIWFPEVRRRRRFLDALVRCEFKANSKLEDANFFVAKEDGRILAVAQLCAPGFKKPDDMTYVLSGWFKAQFRGGTKAVNEWREIEAAASAPCHELTGKNWYISLLSVDDGARGKGIGSKFLNDYLIPYVKQNGAESLSLFTNSEINCRFYAKNGFELFDEKTFEHNGRTLGSWSFILKF